MSNHTLSPEEVLTEVKNAMEGYVRGLGPQGIAKLQTAAQKPDFAKRAAELQRDTMELAKKAMSDMEGAKKVSYSIGAKALTLSLEAIRDTFGEEGLTKATAAINKRHIKQALHQHGFKELLAILPTAPKSDRRRTVSMPRP
ncbi:MAG: hypothetical protein Alpg2KO_20370 [Alphaproteobacteria bacterium]